MKCDCGGNAVWEHSSPGVGAAICEKCKWVVAAYNCPYIPVYVKENKVEDKVVNVLNGGYVRLVDTMGNDLSIVRSARVSYNAEWRTGADAGADEKLIRYLWSNKHTTPFESVTATFEVKAPIFVFRQWHRHRIASYNEVSARYTELDMGWYIPELEQITTQSTSNKQMRTTVMHPEADLIQLSMQHSIKRSYRCYTRLIKMGAPRELARIVLPVAMYSKMFVTVNLHSLFHFLTLRLHQHAQYEVRVYAEALLQLIEPTVPTAVKVFNEIRNK